jgi:hypothetical protein
MLISLHVVPASWQGRKGTAEEFDLKTVTPNGVCKFGE